MVLDDVLMRTLSSLSRINPPQSLPQRLKKDFAWGRRGPATNDEGLYQKVGGIRSDKGDGGDGG
jgi:hypothetical protein